MSDTTVTTDNDFSPIDLVLAMAPINTVLEAYSTKSQDYFATAVMPVCKSNTPAKTYLYKLVTDYVKMCEDSIESELLMELLLYTLQHLKSNNSNNDEACHVAFKWPNTNDSYLRIRIFPHHNDVALRIWEAGAALAEYLWNNINQILPQNNETATTNIDSQQYIVELGAGTGVTSLVAAAAAAHSYKVFATDYTDVALQNMQYNIQLNKAWLETIIHNDDCCNSFNVSQYISSAFLEWDECATMLESCGSHIKSNHSPHCCCCESSAALRAVQQSQLLIAGDVVYDHQVIPSLVKLFYNFLRLDAATRQVIMATTRRNQNTFSILKSEIVKRGIKTKTLADGATCEKLPRLFPHRFIQSRRDVEIIALRLT